MDQHFMDQHGYEITRPNEFFRKYGAFTRYFSDIIKSGISYNTTKIENLVELNMRLQSRQSRFSPNSRDWKNLEYEVNARAILDMELGDMIEHLNLLEDNGSFLGFHALDGTDIRPLLEYVNIPKDHLGSPAPLYHICTEEGFGKWICKDHYQQTIFGKAVDGFLINAQKLGWRNSRRVGKAKITFKNQWDADVFYKCVKGLESLFEMDIGLGWVVSASDLWSLKIALSTSKVAVLSLDVHGLVPGAESPQNPRIEFPRLQSLKLSKMPLNAFVKPSDSYPNLKALHLDNVGPDSSTVGLLTMFSAMVELSIPGRMIGDHGLGILYRSPNTNLRVIDLSRNGITDRGGNMLATILSKSKGVSSINLSHNDLGDTVVAKIIRQLGPRLLSLSLASVGFGLESARMLKNMIGDNFILSNPGARLNCLDLSKSSWGLDMLLILIDIIIAMYDGEAFAPETLDIAATFLMVNLMAQPTNAGHCHAILTENYERPQECLANSSRIRSLQLRDSTVPEDAAEKLVDMLDMSSVTRLELYQLGKVIQPRNVDLTLNRVFANSPGTILNRLSYLDMHQTEARDSAADILAHQLTLGDCQLEYLNLSSNRITSKGVNAILHALCYNRSVITLYMGSQASSDSTPFIPEPQIQLADFLGNNKTVRRIYIPSATITELTAGLASNENIQVLLLDQWEGTYDNAGELGTALRENRGLVQFRIFGERKANASPRSSRDGSKSEMAGFFIRNVASNNRLQILEWPDFLNGVEATDGPSGGGGGASLRRDLSVHSTTSSRSAGSSNSIKSFISSHTSIQTSLLKSPQSIDVPNSQSRTSEESVVSAMGSNPGMVSKSSGKGKQKISGLLNGLLGSGLAAPEPIQGKATVRAEVIAKLPRGAPQRR
ncbi:hypothetical protein BGW38_002922 [Lunasporangiospora selenospora]|uniref:Uncharacterized protein n=1 Tax=Lunasporangiospora selenospora TaxID=979761 RepID=A0A9P6KD18_9FUNG|nr:hypothetical protein BGW38_002922 [Lunasporangiospora selenospora]